MDRSLANTSEKPASVDWAGYKNKINSATYVDYLQKQVCVTWAVTCWLAAIAGHWISVDPKA